MLFRYCRKFVWQTTLSKSHWWTLPSFCLTNGFVTLLCSAFSDFCTQVDSNYLSFSLMTLSVKTQKVSKCWSPSGLCNKNKNWPMTSKRFWFCKLVALQHCSTWFSHCLSEDTPHNLFQHRRTSAKYHTKIFSQYVKLCVEWKTNSMSHLERITPSVKHAMGMLLLSREREVGGKIDLFFCPLEGKGRLCTAV